MKSVLRNICSPILRLFETGDEAIGYKDSHRTILLVVGVLFLLLSLISLAAAIITSQIAAGFPFVIFFLASSVCLIVGGLGDNSAVSKLWGNK